MKQCQRCGASCPDEARFCTLCGTQLPDGQRPAYQQTPDGQPYRQPPQQNQYQAPSGQQQSGQPPYQRYQPYQNPQAPYQQYPSYNTRQAGPRKAPQVLGIIGIIFALILPIVTYCCSIPGVVMACKDIQMGFPSQTPRTLNIIALIIAALNSLLGVIINLGSLY